MTSHTEAAKAAEHQTVLSFDERERILCQFISEPINHDREMAIAIEAATQERLLAPLEDYERVLADHRRLVRELDVLLNGDGAAAQASLCDIVAQVKRDGIKASARVADTSAIIRDVCELDPADEGPDTVSVTVAELTRIIERHSAPVAGEAQADQFIQAAIDQAPEPLRRLGEYLSRVLDEDQWATAERMLLGACNAAPQASAEPVGWFDTSTSSGTIRWRPGLTASSFPAGHPFYAGPVAPQASAEPARTLFPAHLRKMWSGGEVQTWLDQHQGVNPPKASARGSLERYRKWRAEQADKDARPCSCPSGDSSLRHPCAVHPPADQASKKPAHDERQAWAADMVEASAEHLGDECWEWESEDFLFHLWQVATGRQNRAARADPDKKEM